MANEQDRADTSRMRGVVASQITDSAERKNFIARQGEEEARGNRDQQPLREGAQRQSNLNAVRGSFKRGGKVRKTGLYRLHRGERVIAKRSKKRLGRGRS